MEKQADGCRLCLDPFAENISSIDDPILKEQMDKVFHFPISSVEGVSTTVCQNCKRTIEEFYQYSEKVRRNQEELGTRPESKPPIEELKVEIKLEVNDSSEDDDYANGDDCFDTDFLGEAEEPPPPKAARKRKRETQPRKKRGRKAKEREIEKEEEDDDEKDDELKDEDQTEDGEQDNEGDQEKKIKSENDKGSGKEKRIRVKSKEEMERENKRILEFYRMVCELCGEETADFHALHKHFRDNHDCRGYIRCCKRKLYKRGFLVQHMNLHTNPNAYQCELCNKNFKSKFNLGLHHMKIHGRAEDKPFKCDRCTQAFHKEYMLRNHMSSHEKVQCPQCERILSSKTALNVHIINMHSDVDRRMICDSCGQEFLNKLCFERHVKEHMGIEVVKKLQCHICQKWLMGERGLQKHLQYTHYEKQQTHICDICEQQYPNSRALQSHKRVVHIEERFECEFCGKKFKRAINLKEHRTIHTGEVLYACDICGVTMNSKANLYTHTKKNHPLEWAEKKLRAAEANIPKTHAPDGTEGGSTASTDGSQFATV